MSHKVPETITVAADAANGASCAPASPHRKRKNWRSSGEHRAAIGMLTATKRDLQDFQEATTRAYELLRDGQWHSRDDIRAATGQDEGMRRVRELRQCGYIIETRRPTPERRTHEYRLVNPEETSVEQREAQTYAPVEA